MSLHYDTLLYLNMMQHVLKGEKRLRVLTVVKCHRDLVQQSFTVTQLLSKLVLGM